jgi:hypothetical protein
MAWACLVRPSGNQTVKVAGREVHVHRPALALGAAAGAASELGQDLNIKRLASSKKPYISISCIMPVCHTPA